MSMSAENFCYYLKGILQASDKLLTPLGLATVKEQLAMVFEAQEKSKNVQATSRLELQKIMEDVEAKCTELLTKAYAMNEPPEITAKRGAITAETTVSGTTSLPKENGG